MEATCEDGRETNDLEQASLGVEPSSHWRKKRLNKRHEYTVD